MILWGKKVSKNYAFDVVFFHKLREFSDGLTLFELSAESDWYKGDHCPRHCLRMVVLNFTVFEFELYNVNHAMNDGGNHVDEG